jgi:glycosyltransferase 2 family protein
VVAPLLERVSPPGLGVALMVVLAGIFATFRCWREILADLGGKLPLTAGIRVFFLGQLGKYLPGSVWPALAQMELGRDFQVAERASGAAVGVFLLVVVGTGLAVSGAVVPLLGGGALDSFWWLLTAAPLLLVAAVPPVLNRLLGLGLRLARRQPLPAPLSAARLLGAAGWSLAAWLAYGLHIYLLAVQVGAEGSPLLLLHATGAFAAAWCAGFLLLLAPAGAGVREAALVLLLGAVMARPEAAVVAVLSRLLFVVGDLTGSGALLEQFGRVPRGTTLGTLTEPGFWRSQQQRLCGG